MTQIYIKQNIHKHRTQNCRRISPFGTTPVKKHIRQGHAGIVDHSVDLSIKNQRILYKCIIANTGVIWQHAAHTTDQLTSHSR